MDLIYTVPAAIGLGALHSLEPGHGKGVISAYLITTRGKIRDAISIGIISAGTHTFSIVILALITSTTVRMFAPDRLILWIELVAGILITCIGARILYQHLYPQMISLGRLSKQHHEICEHHHGHGHSHHHTQEIPTSLYRLAAIGFFTGLIPCPSAMAIFLAALTADQIPLGVELVAAFSLGSAITMSTLGILVVRAGTAVKQLEKIRFMRSLHFVSSILILFIGIFVVLQSISQF